MANANGPSVSQTEDPSFIELVLQYLPGELRRSVEEVSDAVTPATIARNNVLLSRRFTELGQLREYIIGLFTKAVDTAINEAVEKATSASTSGAPSRSASSFVANASPASRQASAASAASGASGASGASAASGSTPYSPVGFLNGGTRRRKRKSRSHKKRN